MHNDALLTWEKKTMKLKSNFIPKRTIAWGQPGMIPYEFGNISREHMKGVFMKLYIYIYIYITCIRL
jgi:hypothetical protein